MRQSRIEKKLEAARVKPARMETTLDGLLALMAGGDLNPTQRKCVYSATRMMLYMGDEGCAKTTTAALIALSAAMMQPGSVIVVARFDYNDVMETTGQVMEDMLGRLPPGMLLDRSKAPPMKWYIQSLVRDGLPGKIVFRGLKDGLPGSWFNCMVIDEANEVGEEIVHRADGRLRAQGGHYRCFLTANGQAKTHWFYPACTGRNHLEEKVCDPWMELIQPEPMENAAHLPPDYYSRRRAHYTDAMWEALGKGKWVSVFPGTPVYKAEFVRNQHVKRGLEWSEWKQIFRFWDFGYWHPVCLWGQISARGQLLMLCELIGQNQTIGAFARHVKAVTATRFPGIPPHQIADYGDPSVAQQKDTGMALKELIEEGIVIYYKRHQIEEGVEQCRKLLKDSIGADRAVVFDEIGCPQLIETLAGGYRTDDNGKPFKDGFWDNIADAWRYGVDCLFGSGTATSKDIPDSIAYDRRNSEIDEQSVYDAPGALTLEQFLKDGSE